MRVLIVDDEPPARQRLRELLHGEPDVEVAGECGNAQDAVDRILQGGVDLLFLDVQMPVLDGFAVVEALGPRCLPAVVFVTAYDRYAVQAFEARALDYLLKPFTRERLRESLDRARGSLAGPRTEEALRSLADRLDGLRSRRWRRFFPVRRGERIRLVRAEEIEWIEAEGNYVRLHLDGESHLVRDTLASLEEGLEEFGFARIHRHAIVNLERVRDLAPLPGGQHEVRLASGRTLTLSRSFRTDLERRLGRRL